MSTTPPLSATLLDDLQDALAHGKLARRVALLERVTDLFVHHVVHCSDAQLQAFEDVFACLIADIEASARVMLATRLAPLPVAPRRVLRSLAFDDVIGVAAPVLSQSEQLDDATLIDAARSKSQAHLMAISVRRTLSGSVTDVLVERGNDDVLSSVAGNQGADFTDRGYERLVARAEGNDAIAAQVGLRPSLPRHLYLRLIATASTTVRARLQAAHPALTADIARTILTAEQQIQRDSAEANTATAAAHGLARQLFDDGRLDESTVIKFAQTGKFNEASAAIACLANVPVATAEMMMVESRSEGIFILSKIANFSWATVSAIVAMREALSGETLCASPGDRETYERLRLSTAQQVLRFHRMQQAASGTPAA